MRNIKNHIWIIVFVLGISTAFAQTPPPPNNGTTGSGGTNPVGGGAPVGGGLIFLLASAGAYAYTKWKTKTPSYTIKE